MRYKQNAVLTTLRRAQQFFDDNGAALSGLNPKARKALDSATEQLFTLSVTQDGGSRASRGETSRGRSLRLALRQHHMSPIAEIAKQKLQSVPEFSALTLPSSNISVQALVASATAMADAAAPHAATFTDNGLSETFVDELRAAANAVSESIVDRGHFQGRRSGATAGLAEAEKRGRAVLRVLNAIVLGQIGDDAQLRREWMSAKSVQQKPGPSIGAQPVAVTGGEPAATPVAVPTLVPTSSPTASAAPTAPAGVPAAA
jgi:hypothetical protein